MRKKIIEILESRLGRDIAVEIEGKMNHDERGRILKEYEKRGHLPEETYNFLLSKYHFKDLTSIVFGISSDIQVFPKIMKSMIGSGKFGVKGLRKHVRELGYSEDKFEEILQAIYLEIRKRSRYPEYKKLLAVSSFEIGVFYLEFDYEKAEEFLLEAHELRSNLDENNKIRLFDNLVRLGTQYNHVKNIEKGKIIFDKALEIMKEIDLSQIDPRTVNALKELEKRIDESCENISI